MLPFGGWLESLMLLLLLLCFDCLFSYVLLVMEPKASRSVLDVEGGGRSRQISEFQNSQGYTENTPHPYTPQKPTIYRKSRACRYGSVSIVPASTYSPGFNPSHMNHACLLTPVITAPEKQARGSEVQGHRLQHGEFEDLVGYMRLLPRGKKQENPNCLP